MDCKLDELSREKFRERLDGGIDEVLEELKDNQFYATQLEQIEESISNNNISELLDHQMTAHNMELEAVYRAGYRDCVYFLKEIGSLK